MSFLEDVIHQISNHTDLRIITKENQIKVIGKHINHCAIRSSNDTDISVEFNHINHNIDRDLRHLFKTTKTTIYSHPYTRPMRVCRDVYEYISENDRGTYIPFALELVEDSAGLPITSPEENNTIYLGRVKETRPAGQGYIKVVFTNESTTIVKDTKMNLRIGDLLAFTHAENAGVFSWNTIKRVFKLTPSQYQRLKVLSQKLILE